MPRDFYIEKAFKRPFIFARARIGWNIAVGIYYKATGLPWKLADIDDKTCYVGISFYNEIKTSRKIIRPSFAQVYMRTGESQVIRGQPFFWDFDEMGRLINLNSSQMEDLISQSLEVYYNQRNELPERLVIHKSTHFSSEELSGCESASEEIDELDIVHISDYTRFRAFHENYDYPVVRGTVIANSNEAIMFTTGYVPALATYPGPTVPRPIHINCQRIDTSLENICKDIMSLTKLDWNSSTFYTKMPVTLSVSKKVGAVRAEMDTDSVEPPSSYRFYM